MKTRALVVVLGMLLASAIASAQAESAQELIDRALALREEGRDEEALALFQRAHELEASAQTLAQIALAEQALGRFREAERDLVSALQQGGPFITRHRSTLEEALETIRGHLGELELTGGVDGAEVRVNGDVVGTLPLPPIAVEAGLAVVEIEAPGYMPYQRQVEIAPRERARREVTLVPRPATGTEAAGQPVGTPAPAPVAESGSDGGLIAATVITLVLAAGGLATFAGAGASAQSEYDALAEGCGSTMRCTEEDVSSLRALSLAADIGLGVGAAALVMGAVLLGVVLASGSGGGSARLELGPGGARVRGTF